MTIWMVDGETDAIIVSDLLEDSNIVATLVPANEAGKSAALGPPDLIHVKVCGADAEAAIDLMSDSPDVPGTAIVLEQDTLFEEEGTDLPEPQ